MFNTTTTTSTSEDDEEKFSLCHQHREHFHQLSIFYANEIKKEFHRTRELLLSFDGRQLF